MQHQVELFGILMQILMQMHKPNIKDKTIQDNSINSNSSRIMIMVEIIMIKILITITMVVVAAHPM